MGLAFLLLGLIAFPRASTIVSWGLPLVFIMNFILWLVASVAFWRQASKTAS
jgi:hypothetical protein